MPTNIAPQTKLDYVIQTVTPVSYTAQQALSFAGWSTSSVNAVRSLNAGETSAAAIAQVLCTLINDLMNPNKNF